MREGPFFLSDEVMSQGNNRNGNIVGIFGNTGSDRSEDRTLTTAGNLSTALFARTQWIQYLCFSEKVLISQRWPDASPHCRLKMLPAYVCLSPGSGIVIDDFGDSCLRKSFCTLSLPKSNDAVLLTLPGSLVQHARFSGV